MSYNDMAMYPRGQYYATLAADRTVAVANQDIKVNWIIISNTNAAVQTVDITDADDNAIMKLYVPADTTLAPLPPFMSSNGLKIAMASNTADVTVTVAYQFGSYKLGVHSS